MTTTSTVSQEGFWAHVAIRGPDECWEWLRGRDQNGYGLCTTGKRKRADRVAYELSNGVVADGFLVLHRCDNPACVNPAHLWLGTPKDNMQDMTRKGRGRPGRVIGEANHNAKLTEVQVREIRASAASQGEIAAKYGIAPAYVSQIRLRQRWGHVQ